MVRAIPMGGGGGGNQGTDRGRMVAIIWMIVAAIATQLYWGGWAARGVRGRGAADGVAVGLAAVLITSSLALSGVIPQPLDA